MPAKTEWPCDECDYIGKSHQALAYHRRTMHVKDDPPADAKADAKPDAKADAKEQNPATVQKKRAEPEVADEDEDEDNPEIKDGDIPWYFIVPVIGALIIVAGALVFRDTIRAFIDRIREQRPPMGPSASLSPGGYHGA
jgi:hypothetical protein